MSSVMEVYHLPSGRWEQKPTIGTPPLGFDGYAAAAVGNEIFYYGGYCGHCICRHNSLFSFSVDTKELSPTTPHHGPIMWIFIGLMEHHMCMLIIMCCIEVRCQLVDQL